jgi:ribosome-interacting GTPase 1
MPANLPPEYFNTEERYRAAKTPAEKLACLEELLTLTPKHKGTDKLRASLRKRISKLKTTSQTKKSLSKRESAFQIDKEGAGQVVIVGPANVGKSALVAALTNATPEVAEYPYTTWEPTPGMMPVENIQVQLIDTPTFSREYVKQELIDLIRRSDVVLLTVDLQTDPLQQFDDVLVLLKEHRIIPDHTGESDNRRPHPTVIPFLVLANKHDNEDLDENFEIFCELIEGDWNLSSVSASTGHKLEILKRILVDMLNIIRVYSKSPGKKPDTTSPFVLKKGSTVTDFAGKIHQDFSEKLKTARVWGTSVYDGQMVQRDYILQDGDIVELQI